MGQLCLPFVSETMRIFGAYTLFGIALGLAAGLLGQGAMAANKTLPRGYTIPTIDLARQTHRQVVVDREKGQYLGHPTTVLLEDGQTLLIVYPKGHGKGGIVYKRSTDGGKTWGERLPTPASWATSREVPTIHRVVDANGKKRLIMWSGLYPARLAVSEDDGENWSELKPVGDWGGIVVMGCLEPLSSGRGHYMAMFHDDGRFFTKDGKRGNPPVFNLYKTFSNNGGLTWSQPESLFARSDVHLCEPGLIRSPDGEQICVLLRENARRRNSFVIFSGDEGQSWSEPRELPAALTGDRHTGRYTADGRLFISFRDRTHESPTPGDWVAWVGTYDDIVSGREGQYRVRLMDNTKGADCAYPPVEVLPDDTIVTTTYGHWSKGESPYIVSVRLKLSELDAMQAGAAGASAAPKQEKAVLSKKQTLVKGSASQGLALGRDHYFASSASELCRYDKNWNFIEQKTITVKGVNHLGAIHYRDGYIWCGFLNHAQLDGKHDPEQNRSIIAKIQASDFEIEQTWDITADVTWIDPVCFDGTHVWVGDLSDLGLHRYRLDEGKLTRDGVFRYPKEMHFSQGIRIVGRKLYSIHTFGSMDGLFEFDIPTKFTDAINQPTRVWPIQETKSHLEGFGFVPGHPNQLWEAQGSQVDLYELEGLSKE